MRCLRAPSVEQPLDLSRDCAAPLTMYRLTKEDTDAFNSHRGIPRQSSALSVDQWGAVKRVDLFFGTAKRRCARETIDIAGRQNWANDFEFTATTYVEI